jgi:hypothetical protein
LTIENKGMQKDVIKLKFKAIPLEGDEMFMRFSTSLKDTKLITHDSLTNIDRSKQNSNKRILSPRDLGANIFPTVYGSSLHFNSKSSPFLLSFFTGDRPTGTGSMRDGSIEIGIGRKNRFNDDKGIHDGVPELETV